MKRGLEFWKYEAALALQYLRARYYQPGTGRFVSVDPDVGSTLDAVTLHQYLYAANNALLLTDPSGLKNCWVSCWYWFPICGPLCYGICVARCQQGQEQCEEEPPPPPPCDYTLVKSNDFYACYFAAACGNPPPNRGENWFDACDTCAENFPHSAVSIKTECCRSSRPVPPSSPECAARVGIDSLPIPWPVSEWIPSP